MMIKILSLLLLVQASFTVRVTLEGGGRGIVTKEVALGLVNVVLPCSASVSMMGGAIRLEWIYSDSADGWMEDHLFFDNKIVEKRKDKFYFQSPYSLGIKRVEAGDSGYYRCRAILPEDIPSVDAAQYNLIVTAPPYNETTCGFPSDSEILVGESAEFQCAEVVKQANPPPDFIWYKDGVELPVMSRNSTVYRNSEFSYSVNNGTLRFEKVVHGDAGEYYCTASNKIGSVQCQPTQISTRQITTTVPVTTVPVTKVPVTMDNTTSGGFMDSVGWLAALLCALAFHVLRT